MIMEIKPITNAMTVDVEEYFQVGAFENIIAPHQWDQWQSRVEASVAAILAMFDDAGIKASFFILGWVAERHPALVRRIAEAGHEIASHGYGHARVHQMHPNAFREDIRKTKKILEDLGHQAVRGYRAPSFSINQKNIWAYNILEEEGYVYSSSVAPLYHDHYGWPHAPRFAFHPVPGNDILEIPITTMRTAAINMPAAGGGYFRLLPLALSRWAIDQVHARDQQPAIFYFHPWEIDPEQPYIAQAPLKSRLRHYIFLKKMQPKLHSLLRSFAWGRMDHIFLHQVMA